MKEIHDRAGHQARRKCKEEEPSNLGQRDQKQNHHSNREEKACPAFDRDLVNADAGMGFRYRAHRPAHCQNIHLIHTAFNRVLHRPSGAETGNSKAAADEIQNRASNAGGSGQRKGPWKLRNSNGERDDCYCQPDDEACARPGQDSLHEGFQVSSRLRDQAQSSIGKLHAHRGRCKSRSLCGLRDCFRYLWMPSPKPEPRQASQASHANTGAYSRAKMNGESRYGWPAA
jgi:hypothetical protein